MNKKNSGYQNEHVSLMRDLFQVPVSSYGVMRASEGSLLISDQLPDAVGHGDAGP